MFDNDDNNNNVIIYELHEKLAINVVAVIQGLLLKLLG